MPNEPEVGSLDDIRHDWEGTRRVRERLTEFFARERDAARDCGLRRPVPSLCRGEGQGEGGQLLVARCPDDTRRRYETLLYFEQKARTHEEYSILIAGACQIVEAELDRLLTARAAAIADSLVAALRRQSKDRKQAEILERWAAREIPTTIGLHILVLLALRRGCEHGMLPVTEFLASQFRPRYVELLTSKKLGACLDCLRAQFRNPACHGTGTFDAQAYELFARLAVAERRFAAWDAFGPCPPSPGPEEGVFHHHLSLSQFPPAAATQCAASGPLATVSPAPDPAAAEVVISNSARDRDRALEVADLLGRAGVFVRLAPDAKGPGPEADQAVGACKVLVVMCSDAAVRSGAVGQQLRLAWKYGRPYLPLLLEPTAYPEQLEYWLDGRECFRIFGHPTEDWLPLVLQALALAGVRTADESELGGPAACPLVWPRPGLEGLRAVARFTDRIWPVPAGRTHHSAPGPILRDLGAVQDELQHGHPLGGRVRLAIELDQPAHLLLLDEGTSGKVYCLCPSAFAPDTRLATGRSYLPQAGSRHEAFLISGRPGREHLLALVTEEPLGLDWMPTDPKAPARVLDRADIDALLARLRDLDANRWTALSTYFDVVDC